MEGKLDLNERLIARPAPTFIVRVRAPYSTVTLFAKFLGWSTSVPLATAT